MKIAMIIAIAFSILWTLLILRMAATPTPKQNHRGKRMVKLANANPDFIKRP